ncbi:MAG: APC family permease [Bdellovibrionales bacterium]|nr:APC family permease [Bdellovibrionales bacterium]
MNRSKDDNMASKPHKLGEWQATAICGNDITSSCLYVTALSLLWAGPKAPICLMLVAGILWLYRGIYAEVVGALPLNGGAYNALLNTTSKFRASVAACLTILSYLATAVISGSEAIHYGFSAVKEVTGIHVNNSIVLVSSVALLGVFAILTIRGIGESAKVALGIFVFHLVSLGLLILCGAFYVLTNGPELLELNLAAAPPRVSDFPLLFGFSVALLGISGFESSANFVEEQEDGVFPKTLRNMWIAVSVLNLSICFLALAIVPLAQVPSYSTTLLSHIGSIAAGKWLSILISIDAAIVLSGAVLTSFVGVTGLVHRMALDRCLPQPLLSVGVLEHTIE